MDKWSVYCSLLCTLLGIIICFVNTISSLSKFCTIVDYGNGMHTCKKKILCILILLVKGVQTDKSLPNVWQVMFIYTPNPFLKTLLALAHIEGE